MTKSVGFLTSAFATKPFITSAAAPVQGILFDPDLICLIVANLSRHNTRSLSLTCKRIREITNDIRNYETIAFKIFINSNDDRDTICRSLVLAAKKGHLLIVQHILSRWAIHELPPSKLDMVLGRAFREAGANGHLKIVRALMNLPAFEMVNDVCLCDASVKAAKNGYTEIFHEIICSPRFEAVARLCLYCTVEDNLPDLVNALVNSPHFSKIHPESLNSFCERASKDNKMQIAEALLKSNRSKDFSLECLGIAFRYASYFGFLPTVDFIIKSDRFIQISLNYLKSALFCASELKLGEVEEAIRGTDRFKEISM